MTPRHATRSLRRLDGAFASRPSILMRPSANASIDLISRQLSISSQLLRRVHQMSTNPRFAGAFTAAQRRELSTAQSSRNLLAHMETTANNNPTSASAQNGFYQALLRANLPEIVVERYSTGRYATSPACEAAYMRALDRVGGAAALENTGSTLQADGQQADLQAAAQATAAKIRGGQVAIGNLRSTGQGQGQGQQTGDRKSPMYVVVEESYGALFFRWFTTLVKWLFIFYFGTVAVQIAIEVTGGLRAGVRGNQTSQAEAKHQTVRFADVHGCDEAKEELEEVVEFLKNPDKFNSLGGKLPKGVLLVGPPGTGKTMLARAVAGEAGVPFFFMSGSEFDEMYVGVGAKRVRDLFAAARAKSPAIVFIDELDAIGGKRNERDHAYAKQTLNQLLVDLDGFAQNSGIVFLAATNFPQSLDTALTRPGRFDRQIVVPLPDVRGRAAILTHHLKNIATAKEVDPTVIARGTSGFSGAQLENLINIAAVHASKKKKDEVSMSDLDWARDRALMGAARTMVMPPKEKLMTAYHEGGHTLVSLFTTGATPFYKVTVMPRGMALGVTQSLEEMDKYSMSRTEYLARLDVCMGGKVAEELIYGEGGVSSGASNDIQQATSVALHMVTDLGFSPKLGNVNLSQNYNYLSAETKAMIDSEVRRLISESHTRATKLLTSKRTELERLARALMEYETLDKIEVEKVIRGESLPPSKEKVDINAGMIVPIPEPGSSGTSPPPPVHGNPHPAPGTGGPGAHGTDIPLGAAGGYNPPHPPPVDGSVAAGTGSGKVR